jgi:hypothetical protein
MPVTLLAPVRRAPSVLAAVVVAGLIAAGCGGGGDGGADPAAAVPANAPLYIEATVRPDGELRDDTLEVVGKLLDTDEPEAELQRLFQELGDDDDDFSYEDDVEPWLGERVGLYFRTFDSEAEVIDGAVVAAVTDEDAARESIRDFGPEGDAEPVEREHEGVSYEYVEEGDTGLLVTGGYAAIGSDAGIKSIIETLEDGEALADSESYEQAAGDEDESLARVYAEPQGLVSAASGAAGGQAAQIAALLGGQLPESVSVALAATGDALRIDTATAGGPQSAAGGAGGEVFATLPGDALAAAGIADVGGALESVLTQVGALGAFGGFDLDETLAALERQSGLNVREDLLAWMGDGGLFVRGAGVADIGGGLVVASSDPAATEAAVPRLGRLIEALADAEVRPLERDGLDAGVTARFDGLPLPVHLAAAGERFVVAVGDPALAAALDPDATLESNEAFTGAVDALGDGLTPAFFANLPVILQLVDAFGAGAGGDPSAERALAALRSLTTVIAGSGGDDEVSRARIVVGVE